MRVAPSAVLQPHEAQHLLHALLLLRPGQLVDAEGHILAHRQMRKKGVILEHHADAAFLGRQISAAAADDLALQADLAAGDRLEPGHCTQQGGLTAARGANQHADIACLQLQRHLRHRRLGAPGIAHIQLGDL